MKYSHERRPISLDTVHWLNRGRLATGNFIGNFLPPASLKEHCLLLQVSVFSLPSAQGLLSHRKPTSAGKLEFVFFPSRLSCLKRIQGF